MKKKIIRWIAGIATLIIIGALITVLYNSNSEIESSDDDENMYDSEPSPFDACVNVYDFEICPFETDGYLWCIEEFPSNEKIDSVSDTNDLVHQIESIWIKIYGDRITEQRPYKVFYDKKSAIWMVKGTLPENMMGGVAYALVADNTWEVLAIWHDR